MADTMKGSHRKVWGGMDLLAPGEYAYLPGAGWFACTPNGYLANLSAHDVEYDKAKNVITVSPSISVRAHRDEDAPGVVSEVWHGYLEAGTWRAC